MELTGKFIWQIVLIQGLLFLSVLATSVISIYLIQRNEAFFISHIVEGNLKKGDFHEAVFELSDAQFEKFSAIGFFNREGRRIFTLPANINPDLFSSSSKLSQILKPRMEVPLYADQEHKNSIGRLEFEFNAWPILPTGLVLWLLATLLSIPIIRRYRNLIISNLERENLVRVQESRVALAKRVAHDIRSPISALNILASDLSGLPDDRRALVKQVAQRINEIADDLLRKGEQEEKCEAVSAAEQVIAEASVTFAKRVKITLKKQNLLETLYIPMKESEFKRTLSNLLNNAFDAIEGDGEISIYMARDREHFFIRVRDTGIGIPKDVIPMLGQSGFSTGKEQSQSSGTGLGLYHAKKSMEACGGSLSIESELGKGTSVNLYFGSPVKT